MVTKQHCLSLSGLQLFFENVIIRRLCLNIRICTRPASGTGSQNNNIFHKQTANYKLHVVSLKDLTYVAYKTCKWRFLGPKNNLQRNKRQYNKPTLYKQMVVWWKQTKPSFSKQTMNTLFLSLSLLITKRNKKHHITQKIWRNQGLQTSHKPRDFTTIYTPLIISNGYPASGFRSWYSLLSVSVLFLGGSDSLVVPFWLLRLLLSWNPQNWYKISEPNSTKDLIRKFWSFSLSIPL